MSKLEWSKQNASKKLYFLLGFQQITSVVCHILHILPGQDIAIYVAIY